MGDDGARGLLELKHAGGTTVIQDEASSFIWGMPKAGKDLKAANHELNPREIALLMTAMNRSKQ
jgi:two-component system chemotaxis response regulator CheB